MGNAIPRFLFLHYFEKPIIMTCYGGNSLNGFTFNDDVVKSITLISENGSKKESIPKKYWGNDLRTNQYLQQRVKGIIQEGGEYT